MDEADLTQEREERMMAALRRAGPKIELEADGSCHYCSEPVPPGAKFCNLECSSDWQYEQKQRRLNRG
jgi:hypothetical protein